MHQLIIETSSNGFIFERFCGLLISESQNISIVGTSSNYDRGADGRSIQPTRGSHTFVLCVTLAKELDGKVSADIIKLMKRAKPETIYYCSSQPLTEDAVLKLQAEIQLLVNRPIVVKVLGSIQLRDLSIEHPKAMAKVYHAEVKNIEALFAAQAEESLDRDAKGLRLALMALGSDDGQSLRKSMSRQMILDVLGLGYTSPQSMATQLTKDFSLSRGFSPNYVERLLRQLEVDGLAEFKGADWRITDAGKEALKGAPTSGVENLLEGRRIVREAIETLIAKPLSNEQFDRVWSTFLEGFGAAFYTNGLSVVSALNSFLGAEDVVSDSKPLRDIVEGIATKVSNLFSSEDLAIEMRQAVIDIFTERTGRAFDWISGICERFVAMCSLGLESTSAEEIRKRIIRSYLVLDTDIALTLLSESEPDHKTVKDLVTAWNQMGGSFLLATPVLEEAAYHASISEHDFQASRALLGKLHGVDLRRYSENTFVRSFHSLSTGKEGAAYWADYISQFRGETPYDYTNVKQQLATRLGAKTLSDATDEALESQLTQQIFERSQRNKKVVVPKTPEAERRAARKAKEAIDKAKRDGRLLASIAAGRDTETRLQSGATVILISSSQLLRSVAQANSGRFGPPNAVTSLGAVMYMLSLIPNTRLGEETLRRALFEFGESARLKDKERLALRVIKGSGIYQMGWASRGLLSKRLDTVLHAEAVKRGVNSHEFGRQFAKGDPTTDPVAVIASALTHSSAQSDIELEANELRKKLNDAQIEIEYLRSSSKK